MRCLFLLLVLLPALVSTLGLNFNDIYSQSFPKGMSYAEVMKIIAERNLQKFGPTKLPPTIPPMNSRK